MIGIARKIAIAGLIAAIVMSGYFALQIQQGYTAEEAAFKQVAPYKPIMPDGAEEGVFEDFVNQGIVDLQAQYEDAVGWLTIPHTGIDYPFVQADDNDYYLRRDIDENYAIAGTLFMDCQSSKDFSDFNTIIYGHHMKNETMFGPMARYEDEEFFKTNTKGTIFLADKTFSMDIFAYIIVRSDDLTVYDSPSDDEGKRACLDYIRDNARHYRDIGVDIEDQIVTLSTCAYEFKNARMLLLGTLTRFQ